MWRTSLSNDESQVGERKRYKGFQSLLPTCMEDNSYPVLAVAFSGVVTAAEGGGGGGGYKWCVAVCMLEI